MLERLLDVYTVLAGDVAAAYIGRGYNVRLGNWMTVSGTDLGSSQLSKRLLTDADFVVHNGVTGGFKNGILITAYVLYDPTHPEMAVPWFQGVSSVAGYVGWEGKRDMGAGVFWRVQRGALVAGDRVTLGVGYV